MKNILKFTILGFLLTLNMQFLFSQTYEVIDLINFHQQDEFIQFGNPGEKTYQKEHVGNFPHVWIYEDDEEIYFCCMDFCEGSNECASVDKWNKMNTDLRDLLGEKYISENKKLKTITENETYWAIKYGQYELTRIWSLGNKLYVLLKWDTIGITLRSWKMKK